MHRLQSFKRDFGGCLNRAYDDDHAGSSYPTALSTSIVRCTAGRAIIRA
jgi:hypothetical protein